MTEEEMDILVDRKLQEGVTVTETHRGTNYLDGYDLTVHFSDETQYIQRSYYGKDEEESE